MQFISCKIALCDKFQIDILRQSSIKKIRQVARLLIFTSIRFVQDDLCGN